MKKITIIGNFSAYRNNLNGQTMRTKSVYEVVQAHFEDNNTKVKIVDTDKFQLGLKEIILFLKGVFNVCSSKNIILMPAHKAIKFTIPILYFINLFNTKKIHLVAIGGWLYDFLDNNKQYIKYFSRIEYVYVQSEKLKENVETLGLKNIIHFPNFRDYPSLKDDKLNGVKKNNDVYHFVFFSRVLKEKGIELAVNAINIYNSQNPKKIILDIYGPINDDYKFDFESLLNESINYKGVLKPENILNVLKSYEFMVFPTYYHGEGFPGALLDSLSSGVPVIASDWKYNGEIIRDGYNGYTFESKSLEDLINTLERAIANYDELPEIKENCFLTASQYSKNKVAPILLEKIKIFN
ncbi:glycosyltransferase family 4 protein [Priestia megaterium]|uniref:glycosyltransferase family 4 protein n=1 Tax=Priestia megaterium TaxID=1404 RepID=UPI000CA3120F|nr:glycosyltransferase family 4 protein [Priestia megaterium]AUO13009.1 glycosyltransferase family 1 protein [Priestia megaterium]